MNFDPDRHHRRSIRLRGYDYAQAGAYFVTFCTQNRECLFGEIEDTKMRLTDAGRMIEHWWMELAAKFPSLRTDAYVIMPNYLHGIVLLGHAPNQAEDAADPPLSVAVDWFKTTTTKRLYPWRRGARLASIPRSVVATELL